MSRPTATFTHEISEPRITLDPIQAVEIDSRCIEEISHDCGTKGDNGHEARRPDQDDRNSPVSLAEVSAYSVIQIGYWGKATCTSQI